MPNDLRRCVVCGSLREHWAPAYALQMAEEFGDKATLPQKACIQGVIDESRKMLEEHTKYEFMHSDWHTQHAFIVSIRDRLSDLLALCNATVNNADKIKEM